MDREALQERFGIVGRSAAIRKVLDVIRQVAPTDITVLIQGESGVGKELVARAIHAISPRRHKELVIVNCGAIPEGIIESELFGHEKGAFTGAVDSREGYFERANGGTIFLDEIGDMPLHTQVKILRVLESGEYMRVGSSRVRHTDVRVIAATNKDLWQMVQEGKFREDLYYRLDTVTIRIPPLRERPEDIEPLFAHFVREFTEKYGVRFPGLTEEARELLLTYRWPGNVRELRNLVEQLVVLERAAPVTAETLAHYLKGVRRGGSAYLPVGPAPSRDAEARERELLYRILLELRQDVAELKRLLLGWANAASGPEPKAGAALAPAFPIGLPLLPVPMSPYRSFSEAEEAEAAAVEDGSRESSKNGDLEALPSIEEAEKRLIQQALARFNGNRRHTAKALGISERTLYRKLKQYGLS
ncbi:MAG: sigma-54 dependent transcriptional regulator [Bacteroidetes bacterium]|nr:sigma-54 dependent transcriptional regulator [Rhodothermia bacterium]MCS7155118.1 sigma-54 dependent transcriptional regulator [Bacteroidota bacterium]MCX7906245.1 sigma-54 dependent transcriptional regulator [Bacteroidota bacterium]MDW8138773.1 sigma-54 dependent transcriptional regulator [Bacteroidota bacterium]MDW8286426.1 sigma-54 dependent transcriptional regulator [Bacteroidota bacterium]